MHSYHAYTTKPQHQTYRRQNQTDLHKSQNDQQRQPAQPQHKQHATALHPHINLHATHATHIVHNAHNAHDTYMCSTCDTYAHNTHDTYVCILPTVLWKPPWSHPTCKHYMTGIPIDAPTILLSLSKQKQQQPRQLRMPRNPQQSSSSTQLRLKELEIWKKEEEIATTTMCR